MPAILLFYAFQEALHIVKGEGMEARNKRHRDLSGAVRAAAGTIKYRNSLSLTSTASTPKRHCNEISCRD
ncbi:MAG: hypothetical protein QM426_08575 [Euryarchaeota archaeon]|nr:hypothetical protein [Euryarchaeota archaeon]